MTPPALERLVKRCLAKHPDQRWDSAHDVADELRWISDSAKAAGAPVVTVSTGRRALVGLAWMAAALVLAAAGLLAVRAFTRQEERRIEPASFTFDAPASLLEMGVLRISPDGRHVAFAGWDSTGVSRIWLRPIGALTAQPLAGTEGALGPFWSPDSGSIGFFADNKVKRIDVVGRPPRIVSEAAAASNGSWGRSGTSGGEAPEWRADGKELFYVTPVGELMSVVVSTVPSFRAEKPVRLFGDVPPLNDVFGTSYAVTADGKLFLVRMYPGSPTPVAVTVIQD